MNTAERNGTQTLIGTWTRRQAEMYCKDLAALTQEQYVAENGGVTRTAQDITVEVASFCQMVAGLVSNPGAPAPTEEEAKANTPTLDTIDDGKAAVTAGAEALASAVENASEETLGAMITPPWGGEAMPVVVLANIASSHIWYHDGQINFIQALNGDGKVHWM